jgi:hypothetical protein
MLTGRVSRFVNVLCGSVVLAALSLAAREARADAPAPFTRERGSAALGLRFGSNDLNAGIGALGGYTLPMNLYLGGTFDYWFGKSAQQQVGGFSQTVKTSAWNLFGVVGYDFGLMPALVIRPEAGIGVVHGSAEVCTTAPAGFPFSGCSSASNSDAAALFGGQIMYLATSSLHLGGELRVEVASDAFVVIAGNVGLVF